MIAITDKWTMTASGEWIKVPFIREANGDRPAVPLELTNRRAAEQRKDMTNGRG